jgi:septal ring factor EnvC (AmiA/AmiB activator)
LDEENAIADFARLGLSKLDNQLVEWSEMLAIDSVDRQNEYDEKIATLQAQVMLLYNQVNAIDKDIEQVSYDLKSNIEELLTVSNDVKEEAEDISYIDKALSISDDVL